MPDADVVPGSPPLGGARKRSASSGPEAPAEFHVGGDRRCRATTASGERCAQVGDLCLEHQRCVWHDPCSTDRAAEMRRRGGESTSERQRARKAERIRTASPDEVPPLETMDDAVIASAWLYRAAATGVLDPATAREANRGVATFKDALNKRDLLRRIAELERLVKRYERERAHD